MQLSEAGQSRLNGYLFVLRRSLSPSMKSDLVADAVREIESHLRDRVEAAQPLPDERSSLEQILMVTFTRMATGELRERVSERLVSA